MGLSSLQIADVTNDIDNMSVPVISKTKKVAIRNLTQDIEVIISVKHQFENQAKSSRLNYFDLLILSFLVFWGLKTLVINSGNFRQVVQGVFGRRNSAGGF